MRSETIALVLALALVGACKRTDRNEARRGSSGGQAAGKGPTVQRAGNRVDIVSTYAVSHGGSAIDLSFASYPDSCEEGASGMEPLDSARMVARVTIAPLLGRDGTSQWAVAKTYYRGGNRGVSVPLAGGPYDAAARVVLTLPKLELRSAGKQPELVTIEGPIEAKGCGMIKRDRAATSRPQPGVTFSVAGVTMPIQGAVIEREGSEEVVRLSTGPIDCSDRGFDTDIVWELYLSGGVVTRAQMRGAVLASQSSQMLDAGVVTASIHGGQIAVAAAYDQTGYAVKVNGKVDALECK